MKNEKGEERVTIVLASYQEGQVKYLDNDNINNVLLDEKRCG